LKGQQADPKANLNVLETRKLLNTVIKMGIGVVPSVDGWSGYNSRQSKKLFSSLPHPDPFRGPPSIQRKGYCGLYPQGYIQYWD
jgi:hypothetical protein